MTQANPGRDPISLLLAWLAEARAAGALKPTAMALATATRAGEPSVRMVVARGIDQAGITFYTDARSAKGRDLAQNPRAAATFYWPALNRAVRLSGPVETLAPERAAAFFAGYARPIQRAMRVSTQSAPVADRTSLEAAVERDAIAHPDDGPVAAGFVAFRLCSDAFEFWSEAPDALHDRIAYVRQGDMWRIERLQP